MSIRFAGSEDFTKYMSMPDFTTMNATDLQGRGLVTNAVNSGIGLSATAGIRSMAEIGSAKHQADAIRAKGSAEGQASMMSGFGNMFSGLAGGISSLGGGSSYGKIFEGTPQAAKNVSQGWSPSGLFQIPLDM